MPTVIDVLDDFYHKNHNKETDSNTIVDQFAWGQSSNFSLMVVDIFLNTHVRGHFKETISYLCLKSL